MSACSEVLHCQFFSDSVWVNDALHGLNCSLAPPQPSQCNSVQSESSSRTRGCPLSAIVFAAAVEPLPVALRCWWPALIRSFHTFRGIQAEYRFSECFPLNDAAKQTPPPVSPFHLASSTFPYLGINISDSVPSLFKYHIMELVEEIRLDFQRWDTLPHSFVGRINSVKRIFYPTFYFYFSVLTNIPLSLCRSLEISGEYTQDKIFHLAKDKRKWPSCTPSFFGILLDNRHSKNSLLAQSSTTDW